MKSGQNNKLSKLKVVKIKVAKIKKTGEKWLK